MSTASRFRTTRLRQASPQQRRRARLPNSSGLAQAAAIRTRRPPDVGLIHAVGFRLCPLGPKRSYLESCPLRSAQDGYVLNGRHTMLYVTIAVLDRLRLGAIPARRLARVRREAVPATCSASSAASGAS